MQEEENTQFSYSPDPDQIIQDVPEPSLDAEVSWTASEYIAHQKNLSWFIVLGLAVATGVLVALFVMKDAVSAVAVGVIGVVFGVFAARPPQELAYRVDSAGVRIGKNLFGYEQIKSFSVIQDGSVRSILLSPLQRFALPITMHYAPEDEVKITNVLSDYLPYEERTQDVVDRLMRKIRF